MFRNVLAGWAQHSPPHSRTAPIRPEPRGSFSDVDRFESLRSSRPAGPDGLPCWGRGLGFAGSVDDAVPGPQGPCCPAVDGCTVRAIDRLPASIHAGKQASLAVKAATKLTKESQKALLKAPGRRGETLTVTIKAKYGGYTPMEVVKVCDAIKAGDIKRTELKRTEYSPPYKSPRLVPKSTVEMYLVKDPKTQQPKYEALRGRLTMPPKEQPLLTEKVDTFLQLATFWAHRARLPFRLGNPELIAFILAREGKQPTNKQKASMVTLAMTVKNKRSRGQVRDLHREAGRLHEHAGGRHCRVRVSI